MKSERKQKFNLIDPSVPRYYFLKLALIFKFQNIPWALGFTVKYMGASPGELSEELVT